MRGLEAGGGVQAEGFFFGHELGGWEFFVDAEGDGGGALPYIEAGAEVGGDVEGIVAYAGGWGDGDGGGDLLLLEAGERGEVEDELAGVFSGGSGLGPGAHDAAGGYGVFAGVDGDAEGGGDLGWGEDTAGVGGVALMMWSRG